MTPYLDPLRRRQVALRYGERVQNHERRPVETVKPGHARCPKCGRQVRVNRDGALRVHGPGHRFPPCEGSGTPARRSVSEEFIEAHRWEP